MLRALQPCTSCPALVGILGDRRCARREAPTSRALQPGRGCCPCRHEPRQRPALPRQGQVMSWESPQRRSILAGLARSAKNWFSGDPGTPVPGERTIPARNPPYWNGRYVARPRQPVQLHGGRHTPPAARFRLPSGGRTTAGSTPAGLRASASLTQRGQPRHSSRKQGQTQCMAPTRIMYTNRLPPLVKRRSSPELAGRRLKPNRQAEPNAPGPSAARLSPAPSGASVWSPPPCQASP